MARALCVAAALSLAGCTGAPVYEPVQVSVPYPVVVLPPESLTAPLALDPPEFVPPAFPGVTSCLEPAGIDALRTMLIRLSVRLEAWEAWAATLKQQKGSNDGSTAPPDTPE